MLGSFGQTIRIGRCVKYFVIIIKTYNLTTQGLQNPGNVTTHLRVKTVSGERSVTLLSKVRAARFGMGNYIYKKKLGAPAMIKDLVGFLYRVK